MDVLSLCPLPAAPLLWQLTPSRWVVTVVCKATYRLEPGVVALAAEQEPIHDEENHWEDDPAKSLFAPADLVPFKQRADVVLVGSAFARGGQPVRSLIVRLNVGKIEKAVEVLCPRLRTRDGELREGKRWTRMPLIYERAAGGKGTDNPVGIGKDAPRDQYGQLGLPNLQPPGLPPDPDRMPPSIGLGPVAADWPSRLALLPASHPDRDWARAPFGEGFDPMFFQSAPIDQQLDSLRPTERIALENLHPKHPSLVTSLPGDRPRARIELSGAAPREIGLVPDTLWIDTDRSICTVTFRGKADIEHPEQEGRILVALQKGDQPIAWARIAPAPPAPSLPPASLVAAPPPAPPAPVSVTPAPLSVPAAPPIPPLPAAPPMVSSPAGAGSARPASVPAPLPPPPPRPSQLRGAKVPPPPRAADPSVAELDPEMLESVEITMTEHPGQKLDQTASLQPAAAAPRATSESSALPFQPAPPGYKPPAATPSRPGLAPLPGVPADLSFTPPLGAPRSTLPDWFESGAAPPPAPAPPEGALSPPPLVGSLPWTSGPPAPPPPPPPLLVAPPPADGPFSALEASNAAAGLGGAPVAEPPAPRPELESKPAPAVTAVVVELTWLDPAVGPLLEKHPVFSAWKRSPPAEDLLRGHVYDVLTRAAPTPAAGFDSLLEAAEEESPPSPALVLATGTLELCLDEVEMLKAVAQAAAPLASSDKKLKEAIDVATEMLKSPMLGMPDFAEGLSTRIRDAWAKANRALPPDHLSACTERLLLEQRSYQKRELLDDTWIRALLSTGEGAPVPTYLPARIAKRLPLYRRFAARVLAEVVWQQDQYETAPLALRTLALGRLPARARQSPPRARRRG
jgi:hypothetical protein